MKKRVLSLALALIMVLTLVPAALGAEADKPQRGVLTYSEHIAPQYEEATTFSEDLAAVKKDGKWGYIDKDNKVVIPFQYELAYEFSEGYAVVAKSARKEPYDVYNDNGEVTGTEYSSYYKMGFIDKAGKYTPFIGKNFDGQTGESSIGELEVNVWSLDAMEGYFFWNGYCFIDNQLFRTDGSVVVLRGDNYEEYEKYGEYYYPTGPVTEGLVPVCYGADFADGYEGAGWANPATGKVVKFLKEYGGNGSTVVYTYSFNQGLAPAQVYTWNAKTNENIWLWGIMDRNFQWIIQPQYVSFFYHNDSDALFEVFGDTSLAMVRSTNEKYGAVDKSGAVIIPFEYDQLQPMAEGFIPFTKNGKAGYLDAVTLEEVIPAQYKKVSGFSDGMAVVYDGTKAFLIDRKGDPIPGADALEVDTYFKEDENGAKFISTPDEYVVIEKDGKYGFGHIEYLQPLPEKDEMHDWAYDEVTAAIENDLVPSYLQNLYLNDIKRGEMCDVVIQAMEAVLDKDIVEIVKDKTGEDIHNYQHTYPFNDSTDLNVLAANKLGIVNGRGDGVFDPYANITRQEAAAMLMRAAKVLNMKAGGDGNTTFTDSSQVASWAVEAVEYICRAGIMNGKGDSFDPAGSYSREQSFMTIYRLFQRVMEQ